MTLSQIYRARAAALAEQAKSTLEPIPKERFKKMALAFERLAEKYANRLRLYEKKAQAPRGRQRQKHRRQLGQSTERCRSSRAPS